MRRAIAIQCEHCGSEKVVDITNDLSRCMECGEFLDSEDSPRVEQLRRKAPRWKDDDED